jgi:hypothetical protein
VRRTPAPPPPPSMEWKRSETLALAAPMCNVCLGLGLRIGRRGRTHPCNCVLRAIFRACFNRYRDITDKEKYMSRVTLDPLPGREKRGCWGRKDEEYSADFCLISKRTLTEQEYQIFCHHFLMEKDWKACCYKLGLDRGNFFYAVYRIEQKLGRIFRELEPYGIFPVIDYFHGPSKYYREPTGPREPFRNNYKRVLPTNQRLNFIMTREEAEKNGRKYAGPESNRVEARPVLTPREVPSGGNLPERVRSFNPYPFGGGYERPREKVS